ncbi:hypothetical protein EKO23_22305 [Nocardioides guangzhouensis]|uniref:Heavy-metal-associated domain-containing protein n=1 Tax=Nocardioides guangzhouensis TaxID=2497878 RepID=A0A4V1XY69_9ACTN|nr:hypothetical protein [Nocardioides guangzhouensis]RYP82209.1 hypothetical protein EKO23_22305 [Nocardioides guangzhouensis]
MSPLARILALVTGLAVVFGLGLTVGRAVGPDDVRPVAEHEGDGRHDGSGDDHGGHAAQGDLRLDLDPAWHETGFGAHGFRILDPAGDPVTSYDVKHERRLHLIVVDQRSLTDYHHLHPVLGDGGEWTVPADLAAGTYRIYADGSTGGQEFVAERTVQVREPAPQPARLPRPGTTQRVDGYDVHLEPTEAGSVTLRVTRAGEPVDDLEEYLGASGHLVVIRAGSMDYVHAHPEDGPAGPEVTFGVGFDRPGTHRLFFEFQHGRRVHTAAFTLEVDASGSASGDSDDDHGEDGDHAH